MSANDKSVTISRNFPCPHCKKWCEVSGNRIEPLDISSPSDKPKGPPKPSKLQETAKKAFFTFFYAVGLFGTVVHIFIYVYETYLKNISIPK